MVMVTLATNLNSLLQPNLMTRMVTCNIVNLPNHDSDDQQSVQVAEAEHNTDEVENKQLHYPTSLEKLSS